MKKKITVTNLLLAPNPYLDIKFELEIAIWQYVPNYEYTTTDFLTEFSSRLIGHALTIVIT